MTLAFVTLVSIYIFVASNSDVIITNHCKEEILLQEKIKAKIYSEFQGQKREEKLQGFNKSAYGDLNDCIERFLKNTKYDQMNFINKARFLYAIKLLDK